MSSLTPNRPKGQRACRAFLRNSQSLVVFVVLTAVLGFAPLNRAQSPAPQGSTALDRWAEEAQDAARPELYESLFDELKVDPNFFELDRDLLIDKLRLATLQRDFSALSVEYYVDQLDFARQRIATANAQVADLQNSLTAARSASGVEASARIENAQTDLKLANASLRQDFADEGDLKSNLASASADLRRAEGRVGNAVRGLQFLDEAVHGASAGLEFAQNALPWLDLAHEGFGLATNPVYRSQPGEYHYQANKLSLELGAMAGGLFDAAVADTLLPPIAAYDEFHNLQLALRADEYRREAVGLAFGGVLSTANLPQVKFRHDFDDNFSGSFRSEAAGERLSVSGSWVSTEGTDLRRLSAASRYTFEGLDTPAGHVLTGSGIVSRNRIELQERFPLFDLFNFDSSPLVIQTTRRSESYNDSFNGALVNQSIPLVERGGSAGSLIPISQGREKSNYPAPIPALSFGQPSPPLLSDSGCGGASAAHCPPPHLFPSWWFGPRFTPAVEGPSCPNPPCDKRNGGGGAASASSCPNPPCGRPEAPPTQQNHSDKSAPDVGGIYLGGNQKYSEHPGINKEFDKEQEGAEVTPRMALAQPAPPPPKLTAPSAKPTAPQRISSQGKYQRLFDSVGDRCYPGLASLDAVANNTVQASRGADGRLAGTTAENGRVSDSAPLPAASQAGHKRAASALDGLALLSDIEMAKYQDGELIVIGPAATPGNEIRPDDWYVVFRAIAGTEAPGVSIDPGPNPEVMLVRYFGDIQASGLGRTFFEADRTLKLLSTGFDNYTCSLWPGRPSILPTELDLAFTQQVKEGGSRDGGQGWHRFWFQPSENPIETEGFAMRIPKNRLVLKDEPVPPGTPSPVSARQFAAAITGDFLPLAGKIPAFAELQRDAALVALAKWIRDKQVPLDQDWTKGAPNTTSTPATTPSITVVRATITDRTYLSLGIHGQTS